jgi:hypothetical protein
MATLSWRPKPPTSQLVPALDLLMDLAARGILVSVDVDGQTLTIQGPTPDSITDDLKRRIVAQAQVLGRILSVGDHPWG